MKVNDDEAGPRARAEARLFEAALAEVVTGRLDLPASDTPLAAHPLQQPRSTAPGRRRKLLVAAMVLLGLSLSTAVWCTTRPDNDLAPAESPEQPSWIPPVMPALITATSRQLVALPTEVRNLHLQDAALDDLRHLPRLSKLERVVIDARASDAEAWSQATPRALEAFVLLPELTSLSLPPEANLGLEHLRVLARCAKLQSVTFVDQSIMLDHEHVAALAEWPQLGALTLAGISLRSEGVAALGSIERLHTLRLVNCTELSAEIFAALAQLHHLERLHVGTRTAPRREDLARLAPLPNLRRLSLRVDTLDAEQIAALPATLHHLELTCTEPVASSTIKGLRKFGGLHRLGLQCFAGDELHQTAMRGVVLELIAALPLQSLALPIEPDDALIQVLATQPALAALQLPIVQGVDFAPLARLPHLVTLTLDCHSSDEGNRGEVFGEALKGLQQSPSLRHVILFAPDFRAEETAALRRSLGDRIELQHRR